MTLNQIRIYRQNSCIERCEFLSSFEILRWKSAKFTTAKELQWGKKSAKITKSEILWGSTRSLELQRKAHES